MWNSLTETDQSILWVLSVALAYSVVMRLLKVLELRSKRITVTQADGTRLEFRGMSGTEAASLDQQAQQRATAADVRR